MTFCKLYTLEKPGVSAPMLIDVREELGSDVTLTAKTESGIALHKAAQGGFGYGSAALFPN
ncbi:unnamed protein product [Clonostachys rosea]|uniref:Uncharacterized protein n=1 Tax=Bionectria ochroleuca TaxID=29856 RepID=A0ABY6TY75_BIOOC|nr:unnamed protein product [Clonostachys rosea]